MEDTSYIDLKRSLSSIPIKALNYSSRIILANDLDVKLALPAKNGHSRDYRGLAELMGFQYKDIKKFERFDDPTMRILESWETHQDATLDKLIKYLEEMERHDVIKELIPLLERNMKTYLQNERVKENPIQVPEVTSCPSNVHIDELQATRGGCIYYDAYLSYADEDCEFVCQLAKYLESPEIGFKLFIRGRDMLAGCAELDTDIELIKNRCRLMLIILSPNFLRSPACEFQASFAASLAIDQRQRMLIPIVISPCEIPPILKYISKIDFTKPDIQDWVWEKLINSLLPHDKILSRSFSIQKSSFQQKMIIKSGSSNISPAITVCPSTKCLPFSDNSSIEITSDVQLGFVENVLKESTSIPSNVGSPKNGIFPLNSQLNKEHMPSKAYTSIASHSSASSNTSGFHSQSHLY